LLIGITVAKFGKGLGNIAPVGLTFKFTVSLHTKVFDINYHCNRRAIQTDITKCVISNSRSEADNLTLRRIKFMSYFHTRPSVSVSQRMTPITFVSIMMMKLPILTCAEKPEA